MIDSDTTIAARLAIAALVGLAAGLEREWSGHASGTDARFAGLRTFFLLGLLGGVAGALSSGGSESLAVAIAAGGAALGVAGYVMAVRRASSGTDGTTEAAALVVVALGVLAGQGRIAVAAGAGAIVVLMLREKDRLHWMVRRLDEPELRAGLQFAVLAVVVLPLLPSGPFFGRAAIEPRALWGIVLLLSGLNFAGFIARRVAGAGRGLGITGAIGGAISSTAVTLSFSRQSRGANAPARPLARGVLAACTVLVPRVLVVSAALRPSVALALAPLLAPAFVAGVALVAVGWGDDRAGSVPSEPGEENPLKLWTAIRMAIAFQAAMIVITVVRGWWGSPGVFASGAVFGLTDVDALVVSMSRAESAFGAETAARAIAIGVLANTLLKLGIAVVVGRSTYRRRAAMGLAGLAAASAIGLLVV